MNEDEPAGVDPAPRSGIHKVRIVATDAGMYAALALMAAGVVYGFVMGETAAPDILLAHVFTQPVLFGDRLIAFGIVILMLTPLIRVGLFGAAWFHERQYRFAIAALGAIAVVVVAGVAGTLT